MAKNEYFMSVGALDAKHVVVQACGSELFL
jgi:hypothetical protein